MSAKGFPGGATTGLVQKEVYWGKGRGPGKGTEAVNKGQQKDRKREEGGREEEASWQQVEERENEGE